MKIFNTLSTNSGPIPSPRNTVTVFFMICLPSASPPEPVFLFPSYFSTKSLQKFSYCQVVNGAADHADWNCDKQQAVEQVVSVLLTSYRA